VILAGFFKAHFDNHKISKKIIIKYFYETPALSITSYQHFYGNTAVARISSYFVLVRKGRTWKM